MNDDTFYDAIIIGGGPAGLTAALYLARARYRVLVLEKEQFGGQITITSDIVNYPGVETAGGKELTAVMQKQAKNFGAEFLLAEVESMDLGGEEKIVNTTRGEFRSFGVVAAMGASPRTIGFEGEEDFKGRGVAYCATCDGEFFTGLDVFVIGGGFAAAEEAIFLTKYARHVTVVVRRDHFSCAKSAADKVKQHKDITVRFNNVVTSISGDNDLQFLRGKDLITGEEWEYQPPKGETFGVFVFAGYKPATDLLKGQVELDEYGYVITNEERKTNLDGVYAAGDLCVKELRQVVTATADGATAATELERYLATMQEKTGRFPALPQARLAEETVPSNAKTENNSKPARSSDSFFDDEIRAQLEGVFQKMGPLTLRGELDDRPVSVELRGFLQELSSMSDKLTVEFVDSTSDEAPCVRFMREREAGLEDSGLAFHGVPGGHEFNSFVIGIYNAAGPGQALNEALLERIGKIRTPLKLQILVTLSCPKCPDLVIAAQRIAAENSCVTAETYDLNHFPVLRDTYKVMSVPCLVINDEQVSFGKKSIEQLLDTIEGLRGE